MDSSILITLSIPIFFGLILIEFFYGVINKSNNYRINDFITSLSLGLISRFVPILGLGFQYVVYKAITEQYNLKLLDSEAVWVWVTAFILYDVCYYWMHRIHHEIKVFWATHVVHHHGEEFNLSTALRQTSTGFLWKWVFFLPIFFIGIPPHIYVTVAGLNMIYQFWVHTEHIGHLGFLEKIFITPMNHGIHHAKNKEYIDANYGGVFIIWDRMFGTYIARKPDIDPVYGTVSALKSFNPIWANIQIYTTMLKDSIKTKKFSDKLKVFYSKTYWRPEDCIEEKDPKEFYIKYNPQVSKDITVFAFFQMLFTIIVSGSVLFVLPEHTYNEIALFGIAITLMSTFTASLLQGNRYVYFVILGFSAIGILGIEYLNLLNVNLISTQLLMSQLFVNALVVTLIIGFQGIRALIPLKDSHTH